MKMNWSKSKTAARSHSFLDYDAGPPLPPRNQLANSRACRLSDSADLLYEVPHEFANVNPPTQSSYGDFPVYATVQRKNYRYPQEDLLTRSDHHHSPNNAGTWNSYTSGAYATMTWKRTPPPKPPRKVSTAGAALNRSLSQQQYHSKSQHQLHIQSNHTFGYEFVPIGSAGESSGVSSGGSDSMKRSASNDGDAGYSEVQKATSGSSRFSTFLGKSTGTHAQHDRDDNQRLMTDSAFSLLYDEIASNGSSTNSSTLPHPPRTAARSASTDSPTCNLAPNSSKVSSLSRKAGQRAPPLNQHQRSKSEHHPGHHPLCPNFHPGQPHPPQLPRPPLPPKPAARKRDTCDLIPSAVLTQNGTLEHNSAVEAEDTFPERPPSPETAVDGIRSVIKPLSKSIVLDKVTFACIHDTDRRLDMDIEYVTIPCDCQHHAFHLMPEITLKHKPALQSNCLNGLLLEVGHELGLDYKSRSRFKDMHTSVEEDLFSAFDSRGKMVQIRLRRAANWSKLENKLIETDNTLEDLADVRLRDNPNAASTLPRASAANRLSKSSIEDGKKSLRRTKHHATDHTGTAERRKKKNLQAKAAKDASGVDGSGGGPKEYSDLSTALVIKDIEIDCSEPNTISSETNSKPDTTNNHSPTETIEAVKCEEKTVAQTETSEEPVAVTATAVEPTEVTNTTERQGPPLIPFDANKEWEEIEKILESFGSDLCSETLFLDELEKQFTDELNKDKPPIHLKEPFTSADDKNKKKRKPTIEPKPTEILASSHEKPKLPDKQQSPKPPLQEKPTRLEDKPVDVWLNEISLGDYTEVLIENGFDDLHFMGPNGMELGELEELGINRRDHLSRILESAKTLPVMKQLDKDAHVTVDEWLTSLKLIEYSENFKETGFTDIDRVRKIWEVELNALIGVKKLGHRKRVLSSLGKRSSVIQL